MTVAMDRAESREKPWLSASRILLVASAELLAMGLTGRGRPARINRHSGRRVRDD